MPRPFFETLRELRKGAVLDELSEEMAQLVADVRRSGRPGKLSLTLTVKPASRGQTTAVTVGSEVTTRRPKLERGEDVFFTTNDNTLVKNDPNQGELGLELVPVRGAVSVDTKTGEMRA